MRRTTAVLALPALLLAVTGCGGDSAGSGEPTTLRVFSAASLTAAFEQLADDFEEAHEDVEVELNFSGSSDLVAQISEGAPADVFASADETNMAKLVDAGLDGAEPRLFASNTLQIVVPAGNPAGVQSLADLAGEDLAVVVCAPEVPCGAAAQRVAEVAGVALAPVSEEQSVTDVLGKVTSGEADAGLVYVTDVLAAGDDVEGIDILEADTAVNLYPIAPVAESDAGNLAADFVDFVLSEAGQRRLREAGFAPPPEAGR